jgi:EmrB/QacA subfamily drug resistance transporter
MQRSKWWVVAAMAAASIMLTIDLYGVNVALPSIATDLGMTDQALQWVPSIYFLMLAAPLVAAGRLGDVFGHRRVILIGAAIVGLGSLGAALAPDGAVLLGARALSGLGAALVTALSLAIVSDAFGRDRRAVAIGVWTGAGAVGAAAGPLVGGIVTQTIGWRWLFGLGVPIAVATFVVTRWAVTEHRDEDAQGVDVAGVVLVTAAFGLISYALLESPVTGWGEPSNVAALVAGAAGLVGFVVVERRSAHPLLDLGWLRRPPVSGASVAAFCANAAFATVMLYMTLYFQALRGDSPIVTGLVFLAFTVPLAVCSPIAGGFAAHHSKVLLTFVGMALLAAGTAVLVFVGADSAAWVVSVALALNGAGQAAVFNSTNIVTISSVDDEHDGMAAGAISGVRQSGSLFGLALAGAAFTAAGAVTSLAVSGPPPPELLDGIHAAMAVTVGFCLVGAVAARWVRPGSPARAPAAAVAAER